MNELAEQKLSAISWMSFNCVLAAAIPVIIKFTYEALPLSALMAGYNLVAAIISAIWVYFSRAKFSTKKFPLHFVRCILVTSAYFIYFHAVNMTSLANAVAMGYTDAILTCIFSYLILKEHIHRIDIINLLLSFVGAMMIIRPDACNLNMGALLAGLAATLWAFSNVITKILSKSDKVLTQLFYSNFLMFIFFSIIATYEGYISQVITINSINWVIILGIMAFIQSFSLFKALNMARASVVMPFFVVTVISGNLFGYIFFGEMQGMMEMIGTIFVILVGIYQVMSIRLRK